MTTATTLGVQPTAVQGPESEVSKSQIPDPESHAEAEEYFLKAIEIAQRQKAKAWGLRATTSLARIWQQQGKRIEAHKLLSEIYNGSPKDLTPKICKRRKRYWRSWQVSVCYFSLSVMIVSIWRLSVGSRR